MKTEFNIGDTVTFNAYGNAIKAKVTGIQQGMFGGGKCLSGEDDRIFYHLSGINKPLNSITTGRSIQESVLFN